MNVPFVVLEVVGRDLELVRDDLARLLDDLLTRRPECGAADREPAAAVRVQPVRRDARVAVQHLHLGGIAAELVGDDLRPRRLVALAVRRGAGDDLERAGREAPDRGRLPASRRVADRAEDPRGCEPAHLVVRREADADLLDVASLAPRLLLGLELVEPEVLEQLVERRVVVAAVDRQAGGDRGRELR